MFDSGISLESVITDLDNEVDIAIDIPKSCYVEWLNALEHLLYTEIIKEQKRWSRPRTGVDLSDISGAGEADVRFEDIYTVFSGGKQLIKTNLTSGNIFPDSYYKDNNELFYNNDLEVIYFVKPELHTLISNDENEYEATGNIMLPIEFVDMAKAKLRGEAYKLANEDDLAAKWINDYNILLETFKAWISEKRAEFGM